MPPRKLPPNEVLIEMYQSGLSAPEIAEKLGNVKAITVNCMLKTLGVVMRSQSEARRLSYQKGRSTTPDNTGRKQSPEHVESRVSKIRGEKHYAWKGGLSRVAYRKLVTKTVCEKCPSTDNLGVHHRDGNHYNDVVDNLQVLCGSCHSKLHKKEFWDQVRAGVRPAPSVTNLNKSRNEKGQYANRTDGEQAEGTDPVLGEC